jgi:tRNA-splicing ligase RtcB
MAVPKGISQIDETLWEIPANRQRGMMVPGRIYANQRLLESMDPGVFDQVANVASLPGIVGWSFCMPDGHQGYGFPIGGLAAFDAATGIISPGGIGFDINCGMRLLRTGLMLQEVRPRIRQLIDRLSARVPAGAGAHGSLRLSREDFREVCERGSQWCVEHGYGWAEDLELTEDEGRTEGADFSAVSPRAMERGLNQVGTLGSGNHYLEIQFVSRDNIFDKKAAETFGISSPDQVLVMFHCGSRGFGHQVATDFLRDFTRDAPARGMPARETGLACAPFRSKLGLAYYAAMSCAVNVSYANRQIILHTVREVFADVFHRDPRDLGMRMVYDVSHNTARLERHSVGGKSMELLVHRKGATRALPAGSAGLPERYRSMGQPVIIGGSMETGSWLLAATPGSVECFCTSAHGSGRTMSRGEAKRRFNGSSIRADLEGRGIYVRAASTAGLAEESGGAYKDIDEITSVTEAAGISRRVAKLLPIGNLKG